VYTCVCVCVYIYLYGVCVKNCAGASDSVSAKREVFIGIFPSSKTVITGAVNWAEVSEIE